MNQTGVKIAAVGMYAPSAVLTNQDLEKVLDTTDEWITTRTGMKRRHVAAAEEAASDLALAAAKDALSKSNLTPADIDCYIVATATPDYMFPATACIVASKLGASDKPAFDIEIACSGFIYGLTIASSMVRAGVYKRVMMIGAEVLTRIADRTDRSTAVLFGDGAGAVILEASEIDCFLSSELGSDGSRPELLYIPAGGSRAPHTLGSIEGKQHYLRMEGKEVFKFAVTKMIEATDVALEKAHLQKTDLDWLIPHQANKRIIMSAAKYLDMPEEKVVINIEEYGNTSAASIPMALAEAVNAGKIKDGDIVVFVGFGGGLSWGAVCWKWMS
ncbi:MAG TPA: beta-ketoacyl-ACP synthase III [Candidatus Baltobacteraceae bacterium]|nr:beta-ketoacyl-ACP synthase III [Candidatus Baltobacteraceae bacterium]